MLRTRAPRSHLGWPASGADRHLVANVTLPHQPYSPVAWSQRAIGMRTIRGTPREQAYHAPFVAGARPALSTRRSRRGTEIPEPGPERRLQVPMAHARGGFVDRVAAAECMRSQSCLRAGTRRLRILWVCSVPFNGRPQCHTLSCGAGGPVPLVRGPESPLPTAGAWGRSGVARGGAESGIRPVAPDEFAGQDDGPASSRPRPIPPGVVAFDGAELAGRSQSPGILGNVLTGDLRAVRRISHGGGVRRCVVDIFADTNVGTDRELDIGNDHSIRRSRECRSDESGAAPGRRGGRGTTSPPPTAAERNAAAPRSRGRSA